MALELKLLLQCVVGGGCSSHGGLACSFSPWPCGTPCCQRGGSVTASVQFQVGPQPLKEVVFGARDRQAPQLQLVLQFRDLTEDRVEEKLSLKGGSEGRWRDEGKDQRRIKRDERKQEERKRKDRAINHCPVLCQLLSWQATFQWQSFVNRDSFTYANFYPPITPSTRREPLVSLLFDLYAVVLLTFISSRFGGRDTGFVPPKGAELWQLWLPWFVGVVVGAATGRGGEEAIMGLEEEEEDGCWSAWGLFEEKVREGKRSVIVVVQTTELNFHTVSSVQSTTLSFDSSCCIYICLKRATRRISPISRRETSP